jgi:hypothetical protein
MTELAKTMKAHCNNCGPYRTHSVLARVERHWDDDEARIDGTDVYQLLECGGCERVTLRHDSWNSYETDEDGQLTTTTVYYPPAISRKQPEWLTGARGPFFLAFNHPIRRLMSEIYSAVQNDSPALAAMGIRALIEHVMVEKVGDEGAIGRNIAKFISEGYIAPKSQELFRDFLIESGHAAMHRAYFPKSSDILAMLDIVESIIETIYVHPHQTKGLSPLPKRGTKTH